VPGFLNYIQRAYPGSTWTQLDFAPGRNAAPRAVPGDVIAYDWNGDKNFGDDGHLAIVVDIKPGQYPNVSEWGVVKGGQASSYFERGWTWSAERSQWLQVKFPKVRAFLLHVVVK
jgi:hypothetical protein